jgi:hypothetical protein
MAKNQNENRTVAWIVVFILFGLLAWLIYSNSNQTPLADEYERQQAAKKANLYENLDHSMATEKSYGDAVKNYISGLESGTVLDFFKNRGFAVQEEKYYPRTYIVLQKIQDGVSLQVTVEGSKPTEITSVSAVVNDLNGEDAAHLEPWFIPSVASIIYDGCNQDAAIDWATRHLVSGGDTLIGGVEFWISGKGSGNVLNMRLPFKE